MRCNGMPFFPANFMLQTSQDQEGEDDNHRNLKHHQQQQQQPPIFQSQDFNGVAAFLGCKRLMPISGVMEQQNGCEDTTNKNHGEDEASDDESMASGDQKKRRLNMEQVKVLEKSFEMGNKLEPERKAQLARALGLQPRQIAIWFQNRRARWKTKQLEKDYDALKRQFDAVTAHNESLQAQSQELQSQILALTSGREGAATGVATESFNLNKETIDQGSCSNRSENSSDQINNNMVKLDMSKTFKSAGGASVSPGQIPTSMPLFPTSSSTTTSSMRPSPSSKDPSATQLFFHHNQQHHSVKEEHHYSNMFCGIEDQSGFWPWLDQQHNFH